MTEPEQWAVELWGMAYAQAVTDRPLDATAAAMVLQRAFEERERKLREAVKELLAAQDAIDNWPARTGGQEWCEAALNRRQRAFLAVSQALKETPDAH